MRKMLSQQTGPSSQLCLSPPREPERRLGSAASARPAVGTSNGGPIPSLPPFPRILNYDFSSPTEPRAEQALEIVTAGAGAFFLCFFKV